jgi:hypothetical protein
MDRFDFDEDKIPTPGATKAPVQIGPVPPVGFVPVKGQGPVETLEPVETRVEEVPVGAEGIPSPRLGPDSEGIGTGADTEIDRMCEISIEIDEVGRASPLSRLMRRGKIGRAIRGLFGKQEDKGFYITLFSPLMQALKKMYLEAGYTQQEAEKASIVTFFKLIKVVLRGIRNSSPRLAQQAARAEMLVKILERPASHYMKAAEVEDAISSINTVVDTDEFKELSGLVLEEGPAWIGQHQLQDVPAIAPRPDQAWASQIPQEVHPREPGEAPEMSISTAVDVVVRNARDQVDVWQYRGLHR